MAYVTSDKRNRTFVLRRGYFVVIFFILLNFSKCKTSKLTSKLQTSRLSPNTLIQESLVIPTHNAEDEARRLYDEALKQYGDLGKTLKEICEPWKKKACSCSGSSDEVTLVCRKIGITSIPDNLPVELIKL